MLCSNLKHSNISCFPSLFSVPWPHWVPCLAQRSQSAASKSTQTDSQALISSPGLAGDQPLSLLPSVTSLSISPTQEARSRADLGNATGPCAFYPRKISAVFFFFSFCMTPTETQQCCTIFSYYRKFEAFRNVEKNREVNTAHFLPSSIHLPSSPVFL